MIKPNDIRIKRNSEQRANFFKENPDKTWKHNLSKDDIYYIENQDSYKKEEVETVHFLQDICQIS